MTQTVCLEPGIKPNCEIAESLHPSSQPSENDSMTHFWVPTLQLRITALESRTCEDGKGIQF